MTREEAQEYAKTMSYKEAVLNCIHSKGIAYRKASLIKLRELAEIADKLERDNDMTREEAKQVLENELKANCKTCMHPQEVGYCEHTCTYREAMETAISIMEDYEKKEKAVAYWQEECSKTEIELYELEEKIKQNEPKWNCTANFIAEQIEKFNERPQDEKIAFIKRFCGIADKETKSAEPSDLISRAEAMRKCKNAENELTDEAERKGVRVARFIIGELPSADAVSREQYDYVCEEYNRLVHNAVCTKLCDENCEYKKGNTCYHAREHYAVDSVLSAEPKRGKWVRRDNYKVMGEGYLWHCSLCDQTVYQDSSRDYPSENYCPNCGAKMKGAE